jgi:S1-C subfamily serine protease
MLRIALFAICLSATALAGCDRIGELIPGHGTDVVATETAAAATPIVIVPNIGASTNTPTPTPAIPDHELAQSVVQIQAIDTSNWFVRTVRDGTGVVVDREAGLVVTAYALVRPYLSNGTRAYTTIGIGVNSVPGESPRLEYEAELIAADNLLGLAVLRVTRVYQGDLLTADGFEVPAAELGDASVVEPGDGLRLFGHPGLNTVGVDSQALTVTAGTVLGRRGEPDHPGTTRLKLDAQLPYGNTGGPAFDRAGSLVGLLVPDLYDVDTPVTQLRPLNLVNELLEAARRLPANVPFEAPLHAVEPSAGFAAANVSDGAWVSRPLFAEDATNDGGSLDLFDYERGFVSGTQELYFEFVIQGATAGALVEERWFLDGVLQDSLSSSYPWEGRDFSLVADRISVPTANGLPDGRWRLEVWIDETVRAASTAIIGVDVGPPVISNPSFGSVAGESGVSISGPISTAEQMLFFFDYSEMDLARGVRWVVLRDGEMMYQSPEITWPGAGEGRFWVGYYDADGVGAGRWKFDVIVDGESMLQAEWDVG